MCQKVQRLLTPEEIMMRFDLAVGYKDFPNYSVIIPHASYRSLTDEELAEIHKTEKRKELIKDITANTCLIGGLFSAIFIICASLWFIIPGIIFIYILANINNDRKRIRSPNKTKE